MEYHRNLIQDTMEGAIPVLDRMGINMGEVLLDEDLSFLWGNDSFYRTAGCSKEEFQAQFVSLRQYYKEYAEDFACIKRKLTEGIGNGRETIQFVCRFPMAGRIGWSHITAAGKGEGQEGIPSCCMVITDIHDSMMQEKQRAEYFEWMMEEYAGNIYISDVDTYELLYLNKNSCTTLQGKKADLQGKKCYEVIQGRTSPCPFCTNVYLQNEEFYEWEFFNPVLDRTFMIKNRLINWNGHRARIELSNDTYSTEYKLAKKDREREVLIQTIPGGFSRIDARDFQTVLWYGTGFLETIGYTREQFEQGLHSKCSFVHPDDVARMTETMEELNETGQNAVIELRIISHDKKIKILTVTFSYVEGRDSWDGISSYYSVGIDITKDRMEQGRQRKALEEAYQALRVANAAKTEFLSSMSHDIRTPMNAIFGMAAIAEANLDSKEKVKDCLNKINVSSSHLLSLINEVLDMSRIESGRIDLTPQDIGLSDLIQKVSDMCRPLMEEKQHEFHIILGQIRHEKVVADGKRLQQIFMNILSNAIKYTPEGGEISLTIDEIPSLVPQKGWYEFIFEDNGIGMSKEYLSQIFEPFTRAEDARIRNIQGTGLGMAITENIIHMMNGTIEVKNQIGKGSRFQVSLPLQLQAEENGDMEELAGLPVLVVDDEQVVCENAAMLLNDLGMQGYWVLSGEEAVQRIAEAHNRADDFFAVILDWKMPGMDGMETLRAIRRQAGGDVPIIIISAYDFSDIEEEFIHAGADAFITKPLFKSKIIHVLRGFCARKEKEAKEWSGKTVDNEFYGKRLLLVEDNELNREIACELLRMKGFLVETAEDGKQAVEVFGKSEAGCYSAILMDVQMPVMNGYEAAAAIRAMEREDAGRIPIIALTANAFVSDIGMAQSVGMNAHVAKPMDVNYLTKILKKWI